MAPARSIVIIKTASFFIICWFYNINIIGFLFHLCDELNYGEIKVNGVIWTAVSVDSKEAINKDEVVVIVAIEGNKLVVKKGNE